MDFFLYNHCFKLFRFKRKHIMCVLAIMSISTWKHSRNDMVYPPTFIWFGTIHFNTYIDAMWATVHNGREINGCLRLFGEHMYDDGWKKQICFEMYFNACIYVF